MSKRYPGNFITGNPVALSQTSNNGIWDVTDVSAAVAAGTWQEPDGIYEIPKSLRFRASASAYLSRTPSVDGNRKVWTWSAWVKRGQLESSAADRVLFSSPSQSGNDGIAAIYFNGDKLHTYYDTSGLNPYGAVGPAFYRDPSAWYHIVWAVDAANTIHRVYVNNILVSTDTSKYPPNYDYAMNRAGYTHTMGTQAWGPTYYFDGYMSDVNFVDGQSLDPSYFGYFDPITNIWQPKKYTGAYGTNGFYLPFTENGSTVNIGRNFANGSNLVTYSEQFNTAPWTAPAAPTAATVTANQIAAPDGTTTADMITFGATNNHPVYQDLSFSIPNGGSLVTSMYVKKGTGSSYNLQNYHSTTYSDWYNQFTFNSDGTQITNSVMGGGAADPITVGSTYLGNGWHRVWCIHKNTTGSTQSAGRISIGTNASVGTIYVWGAQTEYGDSIGLYAATTSAAVNNNWTPNSISLTAGLTYDSMVDSPTNVFTSATDIGGVVSGNYCTLNPVDIANTTYASPQNGNLYANMGTGGGSGLTGTMSFKAGKYYFEATPVILASGGNNGMAIGITYGSTTTSDMNSKGIIYNSYNGAKRVLTVDSSYGAAFTTNDVIGIAVDGINGTLEFYKNGVSQGVITESSISTQEYRAFWYNNSSSGASQGWVNFGQRPFVYTPPAGFKSLNTTNLQALGTAAVGKAAIQPNKWFDTVLYGGTGQARTITNPGGFVPDLVWTKSRSNTYSYNITDSVRGAGIRSYSDGTAVEAAIPNGGVTSFNTISNNGYDINGGVEVNELGKTYISWHWKQSPTSGFNIITYTGNGTSNRAISHNLGVTPGFQIVKARSGGNAGSSQWLIHHQSQATGYTHYFNSSLAADSGSSQWGSSAATSSNFYVGYQAGATGSNETGTLYVAYLWAEVPGFSRFGSYTGNSSADGPFMYCGFRPRWITIRSTSALREWNVWDTARGPYNINNAGQLNLGDAHAEYTTSGYNDVVDFLSNGFKLRSAVSPNYNQGETYLWAAFAESPFALNNRAR